jgi:hypothetical protein
MYSKLKICFFVVCLFFILACSESTTEIIKESTDSLSGTTQSVNFFSVLLKSKNTLDIVWKTNNISVDDIKQIEIHFQPPGDFSYNQLSALIDPQDSQFSTPELLTYGFGTYKLKLKAILNDLSFVSSPEYDYSFTNIKTLDYIIKSGSSSSDLFSYPEDIGMLSDGSFVITDRVNNRVLYYDSQSQYRSTFQVNDGVDLFNSPMGTCVSVDDDVGIVDTNNNRLVIFNPKLDNPSYFFVNYTDSSTPYLVDCAFDNNKNIIVSDLYNNAVIKFSFGDYDTFSNSISTKLINSNLISAPWGLLVHDSQIYVVEKGKGQVSVFDETGSVLRTIGELGNGDAQLREPRYLAIDSDNIVYVSDSASNDIELFDLQGNTAGGFGIYGTDIGEFNMTRGVGAFGESLFVIDQGNNRIQKFK